MSGGAGFQAGAGRAEIRLDAALPIEGFTAINDPLHVRALIMETDERTAVVSIELTSLPDDASTELRALAGELTGTAVENVWLTLTHSFSGPHIPPSPPPGTGAAALKAAVRLALSEACAAARRTLRKAAVSCGSGESAIVAGRDVLTPFGWWIDAQDAEARDRSIKLLRIDASDGSPLALLTVCGMRSCVMEEVSGADGGHLISADLCGAVCSGLEARFGVGFTALWLCGAAGDQKPCRTARRERVTGDCGIAVSCLDADGARELLREQSTRLAGETLAIWQAADKLDAEPRLRTDRRELMCKTKKMNRDRSALRPARELEYLPEGSKPLCVYALTVGDFALVGVQPELGGATTARIASASAFGTTATAIQVNGSEKCMPEAEAYTLCKYQCQNSPFMPGSAEALSREAEALIETLAR